MNPRLSIAILLGGIAALALGASFVASTSPDGLERVAADQGFDDRATVHFHAPLADYGVPGASRWLSGPLAGLIGTISVGGVAFGAGRLLRKPAA